MKNITEDYFLHRIKASYQKEANLLLATTGVLKSALGSYTLVITHCSTAPTISSEINFQHCKYQALVVSQDNEIVKTLVCEGSPNQCFDYFVHQFENIISQECDVIYLHQHDNLYPDDLDSGECRSSRLKQLQQEIDDWINTTGIRYFSELTNLSNLIEEVGELARLIGREFGEQSFKKGEQPKCIKAAISDELTDVLFIVICLANQLGINLDEAFNENMNKKNKRDRNRHVNNSKLK
ncbi:nucleotide pyrophosphohydrolase [Litorilituus lipolyticus]|uniref:NTP pyrophosphohydrolase MazG-like domain-containing protein n=1 Tax=Litorilituus lipolyticus TaxID=2491017 RepID=A0A502KVS8_9GAMM|nr:nucleotide pyrophosphohydrolase [Litorilituus lipolyticus]TPH15870.1 hypothetical protein EPA86_07835 [Litorilituus lipolyticus]